MSKPKIYIVFYSCYGHVYKLAQSIQKGAESAGVDVKIISNC